MNKTRRLQKTDFSRLWANTAPWLIFTSARLVRLRLSTAASAAAELSRTASSKKQHFSEQQPPPLISCPLAGTSCSVSAFSPHFSSFCSTGSLAPASLPQTSRIRPSLFCWQRADRRCVCLSPPSGLPGRILYRLQPLKAARRCTLAPSFGHRATRSPNNTSLVYRLWLFGLKSKLMV